MLFLSWFLLCFRACLIIDALERADLMALVCDG